MIWLLFARCILFFSLMASEFAFSQTFFLRETIGLPVASTPISVYTGWSSSSPVQFIGTAEVRNTQPSTNYSQASGSGNIFFSSVNGKYLQINHIPVARQERILLSFGFFKSSIHSDATDFVIDYSVNGIDFIPIPFSMASGTGTSIWKYVTLPIELPSIDYFSLRFRQTGVSAYYRIDDILVGTMPVLPVRFLSFTGVSLAHSNHLTWSTSAEYHNYGFQVERSTDGQSFHAIGLIKSKAAGGNSQSILTYEFMDGRPSGISNLYRLRQIDLDDRHAFSQIIRLTCNELIKIDIQSVYPTPTRGLISVLLNTPTNETIYIRVLDMGGRIIETRKIHILAGTNSIPIDLSKQAKGLYLISVGAKTIRVVRE